MNSKMDPMGRAIAISPLSVETMKERGIKESDGTGFLHSGGTVRHHLIS